MNVHMPVPIAYSRLKSGLSTAAVSRLVKSGKLSWDDVYSVVPERTFKRRVAAKETLRMAEADAVARLLHIVEMSLWAFQDKKLAQTYLHSSNPALGGHIPWDMAHSEVGAREVEAALIRFVHGVYV
jgi:putative toxin-antitoxin system antitoxin component (TIGR02293 family)